ncbi:MAG: ATP-dependent zinc protease, partial [Chloroflexi bacterium]|nr:ATP-dependent zinc protease [Chloroflexota bacterium]
SRMWSILGKKIGAGILTFTGIAIALFLALFLLSLFNWGTQTLGEVEHIRLITPQGEVEEVARIDTGADSSSIDERFAVSLGFIPNREETRKIVTEVGTTERPTIRLRYFLGNREISTQATVTDRSNLATRVLIGKSDLQGFVVDPSRAFLAPPEKHPVLQFFSPLGSVRTELAQIIIMIPILGSVIVLLRLLAGVRTYGVFAPTIIGLTLLELGLFPGIILYIFLVTGGVAVKVLIIDRLRMARIAGLSLIMFILVLLLAGVSLLPRGLSVPLSTAFFPLIVTSHLIEQAARGIEEHGMLEVLIPLASTMATALVLAGIGLFLIKLPPNVLWMIFVALVVATILAGYYLGLRFTELIRFKFLRRTHVHR